MKFKAFILSLVVCINGLAAWAEPGKIQFDFYGDTIEVPAGALAASHSEDLLSFGSIKAFYGKLDEGNCESLVEVLRSYKAQHSPDDWLLYQLIRRTAQHISPKAENYERYTVYKWFLLNKLGYDAILSTNGEKILLYVQTEDNIYNIPFRTKCGKRYACLNYHDYAYDIDFAKAPFKEIAIAIPGDKHAFSYKLTHMPQFKPADYVEKDIRFTYADATYHFKIKTNEEVKKILVNYPVMDYQSYYHIPMSSETYNSLIPQLKSDIRGKSVKNGVSFLMHFTRYSFLYKPDQENFGREKRLSPEQTLLYEGSDCEDRVALFFYLVKEIYNLPMIVLTYPDHVSIAVAFDQPVGTPIMYNGKAYSICEPTPQSKDLPVGKMPKSRSNVPYEIAYAYNP